MGKRHFLGKPHFVTSLLFRICTQNQWVHFQFPIFNFYKMAYCSCTNCPLGMYKDVKKCCIEVNALQMRLNSAKVECILDLPSFLNIFNVDVHTLYINIMSDVYQDDNSSLPLNSRLRYSAYRTSTSFIYGKLGHRKRTPLPSCLVAKIRDIYPSLDGQYTGFKDALPQLGS